MKLLGLTNTGELAECELEAGTWTDGQRSAAEIMATLRSGECVFLVEQMRWVMPERIGTIRSHLGLELARALDVKAGAEGTGEPGTIDMHWLEVRDETGEIIKRAVHGCVNGIEMKASAVLGEIG